MPALSTATPSTSPPARGILAFRPSPRTLDLAVSLLFWAAVLSYALIFCALSLRRYDAFLMHALDMGNMEQAVWNTLHGHPFRFTNMRAHIATEAFGTDTRLSFHVEPILLPVSLVHLLYPGPQALLVLQTLVLATGAFPARALARRHLAGSRLAEIVFPLAYLLFPALQAANLYEFHPVTLTGALLLWALDYADQALPLPFILFGVAATACKEEIGLTVALMALWSIRRGMSRRVAIIVAAACTAWSLIAVLLIVPAAQRATHSAVTSSPYLTRYLDRNLTTPGRYAHVTIGDVLRYWLAHPDRLAGVLVGPTKRGFIQRLLAPAGYLSLLSPLALVIGLPSFALIVFSVDQHMYGGLGHYSAELVGVVLAGAVFGLAWLAAFLAERRGVRPSTVITGGSALLLLLSLANARLNGFGPFTDGYQWPAITTHDRIAGQMLALIPPNAAVSSSDMLDAHLSDRAGIYLFPDTAGAEYVALDVSTSPNPARPVVVQQDVAAMLRSRMWDLLFADDGLLLLHRRATPFATAPHLPHAFYSFALPAHPTIEHPLRAVVGGDLLLLGYTITRMETVNLRVPDVILTTYWQATRTVRQPLIMPMYLTDIHDKLTNIFTEQAALAWLPVTTWRPGQMVAVSSTSMGIGSIDPGTVQACVTVHDLTAPAKLRSGRLPIQVLSSQASSGPFALIDGGRALCVGRIPVVF